MHRGRDGRGEGETEWLVYALVQRSKAGAHQDTKSLGNYSGGQAYDPAQEREGPPCKETNQCM